MAFSRDAGELIGDNGTLRIAFDASTGAVDSLRNLVTGQELLAGGAERVPWRLLPQGRLGPRQWSAHHVPETPVYETTAFTADVTDEELHLAWDTSGGVRVEVDVAFAGDDLHLSPRCVVQAGVSPPESLCYPVLSPVDSLDGDDRLLFPAHSGLLIADPTRGPGQAGPYPDGYSGCSLQMSAYFATGTGGFSMSTHDTSSTHKGFGFTPTGWFVWHDHYDMREGSSLLPGYPVVIKALTRGDWYEAAEHYREWALANAPWCADGPRRISARSRWLHEEIGFAIWGAPSSIDWSPWYRDYAAAAGTPVHVIPGWDWTAQRPPTTDHWFPANFHPANVEAWRGHYATPYMNDWFVSVRDFDEWEPEVIRPHWTFPWAVFTTPDGDPDVLSNVDYWACPASEKFADLHERRDLALVRDYGMHGVCYDISCGNPILRCLQSDHNHPPGWGRGLMHAYADVNARSRDANAALGTECIVENIMGALDFYSARACGGPLSALEADVGGSERAPGEGRELVPLFDAVYHDYSPVREDVWCELSQRQGDIFFWTAARCVLQWGGVLTAHYAINFPGPGHGRDEAAFVAWDGATYRTNDLPPDDPRKLEFVGELAAARTGYGNRYLGWGRLLPPPDVDAGTVSLSYAFHSDWLNKGLVREGAWDVPRVIASRWEDGDGRAGVFLCNVGPDAVIVDLDPSWGTTVTTRDGATSAPEKLELGPRTVALVDSSRVNA